jgi:hypothetical protein
MSGVFLELRLDANGVHLFLINQKACIYYTVDAGQLNRSKD